MVTLLNNFDGGPAGTTVSVANSGQDGNDAFDSVTTAGVGVVCRYADAATLERPTAEFVWEGSTAAAAGSPRVLWFTSIGSQNQVYMRMYIRWPTLPNNVASPILFRVQNGSSNDMFFTSITSTGLLAVADWLGNNSLMVNSVAADAWIRVECRVQFSATTGNTELRYYEDPDSDTATETLTWTGRNFRENLGVVYAFGYGTSDTNLETMYLSGLGLSTDDWLGPAPFKVKGVPGIQPSAVAIHNDVF